MAKITIFGEPDERTVEQLKRCATAADYAALMADSHVGYSQPIGGAVAYPNHISPSGVGFDIACGNLAVRTPLKAKEIDVPRVMDEIATQISFGVGRTNNERVDHPVLDHIARAEFKPQRNLLGLAREQLGTVGSGNHYVDLFEDENGDLWVGVHFGSRGFGHRTATGFLALAQGKSFGDKVTEGGMDADPILFDVRTPLGQDYIAAMHLAGEYAYAGREWVVGKVLDLLGTRAVEEVHNHHNWAWKERHFGQEYWVVRKGCTPAHPGQRSFVGGSMGDISVILEGVDTPQSRQALYSTVHGAGRVMSRTQAAGKKKWVFDRKSGRKVPTIVAPGMVDWPSVVKELRAKGIELRGGGADEAPMCYKRLPEVLAAQGDTVRILHTLRPIGVAMAGLDTYDPYKD